MTIVKETHYRTFAKLATYRLAVAVLSVFIAPLFGATMSGAVMFAITSLWLGGIIYYFHERAWLFTKFNRSVGNDGQLRSIIKTITYRLAAMGAVFITALLMVNNKASTAAGFTIATTIINVSIYYIIERIYNKISWGKINASIRFQK